MPKERSTKRQRVSTSSESATQAFLGRNIDLLARPFSLPAELDAATQEVAKKALKLLKGKREGKVKPLFHEARREAVERQLRVLLYEERKREETCRSEHAVEVDEAVLENAGYWYDALPAKWPSTVSNGATADYAKQINRTKQLALKKKKLEEMLHHYQDVKEFLIAVTTRKPIRKRPLVNAHSLSRCRST